MFTEAQLNTKSGPELVAIYNDMAETPVTKFKLKQAEDELLVNSLSMLLDFEPEDKQALLEAPSLETRRETLITLIEFALRGGAGEDLMQ